MKAALAPLSAKVMSEAAPGTTRISSVPAQVVSLIVAVTLTVIPAVLLTAFVVRVAVLFARDAAIVA